ncbi:MAG: hemolysin family protein [Thermoplasmatota archaeon]
MRKGIPMGTIYIVIMILIMLILLYLAGWFAGSETALTNLSPSRIARMRKEGRRNSDFVMKLRKNLDKSLITILVANNIVNILLSSIAALFANALFDTIGVSIMVGVITFLIIAFGEIAPKSNAIVDSEKVTLRHARILYYLSVALTPVIFIFIWISEILLRIRGKRSESGNILVSDQAIKDLVSLGEEEGVIKSIERDIIHGVFNFGDRTVEEIMVPMKDVFFIDRDHPIKEGQDLISTRGFTRIPYLGKDGKIEGLVYSKDLLKRKDGKLSDIIRPTVKLKADTDASTAFEILRNKRIHMAAVINDKGNDIGIVTMEDIIEEIVGEIYDEYFKDKMREVERRRSAGKKKPSPS